MAVKPGEMSESSLCAFLLTSSRTYRMTSLLVSPLLSADLFQDLSQLQETWLTEGEFSSRSFLSFFFFFTLTLCFLVRWGLWAEYRDLWRVKTLCGGGSPQPTSILEKQLSSVCSRVFCQSSFRIVSWNAGKLKTTSSLSQSECCPKLSDATHTGS